jgi:hypothetical protein
MERFLQKHGFRGPGKSENLTGDNGSGILEIVFVHHGAETKEKLRSKQFDNGEELRFFLL